MQPTFCKYVLDATVRSSGLCQGCIQHNVAEGEKEVDTQHSDNDEKKESFEDLPDHLKLGEEFTMRVTVLQAYGVSPEYTDLFTQFKYVIFNCSSHINVVYLN